MAVTKKLMLLDSKKRQELWIGSSLMRAVKSNFYASLRPARLFPHPHSH